MGTEYEGCEICFYPSHNLSQCLKTCVAGAAGADGAGEDKGLWDMGYLGRVPPPSSAAHSDIGCRREESQQEDSWVLGL